MNPPFSKSSGPRDAPVVIVGEAPGEQEELVGAPFIGASGQELTRMLDEAGIERKSCFLTNVFTSRPPNNKLDSWCGNKMEVGGAAYALPPLSNGKYIQPRYLDELSRLAEEINTVNPRLVIAAGGTASWALLKAPKITSIRGSVTPGVLTGHKVLPTFHPSSVLRNWSQRPIVVADLMKAKREMMFPEIRRPERTVYIDPEPSDLPIIEQECLAANILGVDIETKFRSITCIGFAPSRDTSFVIPFFDPRKENGSYWETLDQERRAWETVETILSSAVPKVFQNGLYDLQYILRFGLRVANVQHDTMIMHHAKWPELQKSLGFMGSIHTDEQSWKLLRPRGEDSTKRDDI